MVHLFPRIFWGYRLHCVLLINVFAILVRWRVKLYWQKHVRMVWNGISLCCNNWTEIMKRYKMLELQLKWFKGFYVYVPNSGHTRTLRVKYLRNVLQIVVGLVTSPRQLSECNYTCYFVRIKRLVRSEIFQIANHQ